MKKWLQLNILSLILIIFAFACVNSVFASTEEIQKNQKISALDLQKKVMNFADLYVSLIADESRNFYEKTASEEDYQFIKIHLQYSTANAFIIAAGSSPNQSLLDMLVMISLGHSIIKNDWQKEMGKDVLPIAEKFAIAEKTIWGIANLVLSKKQQEELKKMIKDWRRNYPEILAFSYIRFQSFSKDLEKIDVINKKQKNKRTFMSSLTEDVTTEVEKTRILGERGIYLASRLPLMTGGFLDLWVSSLADNPDAKKILYDISQFADVSSRMATSVEELPVLIANERSVALKQVRKETEEMSQVLLGQIKEHVANERSAALKQVRSETEEMSEIIIERIGEEVSRERNAAVEQVAKKIKDERQQLINDLNSHEKLVKELLIELRQTLQSGTEFVSKTDSLVAKLNGPEKEEQKPSKPFDIVEYKDTIVEASVIIDKMNIFMKNLDSLIISRGWEQSMDDLFLVVDRIGSAGDERIDHFYLLGFRLIGVLIIGQLMILLIYRYISFKFFSK